MKQRINFLPLLPKLQTQRFSLVMLIVIDIIWFFALMGVYAYDHYRLPEKEAMIQSLQQDQIDAEQRLKKVEQDFPEEASTAELQRRADTLSKEIAGKSELINVLSGDEFQNMHGFSAYLQALADDDVSGISLTSIVFSQGGKIITLNGQAVSVKAALAFSQQLSRHAIFSDDAFKLSKLSSDPQNQHLIITLTNSTKNDAGEGQ